MASLTLAALGVVFGDIGTSPLYTVKECFSEFTGLKPVHEDVLAILSLIFALPIVLDVPLRVNAAGVRPNEDQVIAIVLGGLSSLVIIVTFVVGGLKGILVLNRPAVRRAFGFITPAAGDEED